VATCRPDCLANQRRREERGDVAMPKPAALLSLSLALIATFTTVANAWNSDSQSSVVRRPSSVVPWWWPGPCNRPASDMPPVPDGCPDYEPVAPPRAPIPPACVSDARVEEWQEEDQPVTGLFITVDHVPNSFGLALRALRLLGRYPSLLGRYPSPLGRYPSPLGLYPSPLGRYPSPLGRYPSPLGRYPSPLGLYPPGPLWRGPLGMGGHQG